MAQAYDVVVIGGGAIGTATARTLAERGRATLLLERFEIGHARGGSGGPTRIFRLAHEAPQDVRMARLALDAWRELEDRADEALLRNTGGVDVGHTLDRIAEAMEAAGVPFERITAEAVAERWPALRPGAGPALVQEDAGVIMAARTIRAQARLATQAGARIVTNAHVLRLSATGFGVEIETDDTAYHATIAVVTAGAWTDRLLDQVGLGLSLVPTLEQVTYFELEEPAPMPVVLDRTAAPAPSTYVVPNPERPGAFKVGLHHAGPPVDPDDRSEEPDPERERAVVGYAAERLAPHRPAGPSETCLYANTPDGVFVLDRRGPLVLGSACNGHGFKFTPLVGRILADLATAQPAPMAIERFLATRPSLTG
ncbi:MAG TPA: FAD-dependent oxidoreductase [Actinomycetota bacterium]|nr:FAD-dependent oxidoreductase [Actinomycetota bacterium]